MFAAIASDPPRQSKEARVSFSLLRPTNAEASSISTSWATSRRLPRTLSSMMAQTEHRRDRLVCGAADSTSHDELVPHAFPSESEVENMLFHKVLGNALRSSLATVSGVRQLPARLRRALQVYFVLGQAVRASCDAAILGILGPLRSSSNSSPLRSADVLHRIITSFPRHHRAPLAHVCKSYHSRMLSARPSA